MSHSSRPDPRGDANRPRRRVRIENLVTLEDRMLPAPVVASTIPQANFTAAAAPSNDNLGTVSISAVANSASAAALTSVAQLTSANSFGGDIVRIKAGPGGDFGKGVYAISRGAGENADATSRDPSIQAPINRPGVIYRVDPATGKTSVFFDLNTVINQLQTGGDASNGSSPGSGLLNWYDIAFDPEGYFDGKPSMFVSSLSQSDPTKNVIYRIGPDGSFMGLYIQFTAGATEQNFTRQPSALLIPPPEQQSFLKGLFVGQGTGLTQNNGTAAGGFAALFFDANQFSPGANLNGDTLPNGVTATPLTYGPQVGLTSANSSYTSPVYSAFSDFGTPGAGGVAATFGLSGVQGLQGEIPIGGAGTIIPDFTTAPAIAGTTDGDAAVITPFRRFQDIAFDQYGYFSYGTNGNTLTAGAAPTYEGSLFVSDLATGLTVPVNTAAALGGIAAGTAVNIPIQGAGGPIGVTLSPNGTVVPIFTNGNTTNGTNLGGRILRVSPTGVVSVFADNFHTNGAQDASSFVSSELSISFSADGTTLYAADDDGIWQFKTVTDLAGATSGSLIGLNDLRTLGVPYDGQDSAVAIVDTGVDSLTPNFRGRVATGLSVVTNGPGNDDTAAAVNGHGTLVAGVVAQFVPQATLDPVNVFTPNQVAPGNSAGAASVTGATTPQNVYTGLDYVANNPFVRDPIRPNTQDRVIAANVGFGTTTTYGTETQAYNRFPQITLAFENEFAKFRRIGIQGIAAAGQFGTPQGATVTGGSVTGGDVQGIAFPAVLDTVISVTGSYSYPFTALPTSSPVDPGTGVIPRPPGPALLYGSPAGNTITGAGSAATVASADAIVFKDKLLASSNRSLTTDYTAPELDLPTFRRTAASTIGATTTAVGAPPDFNDFSEGGTSLSSAVVTGSYAMVASALDYWQTISNNNGLTVDGYLTTPAGVNQLNFGKGGIENLSAYSNPDGINSILQWTAVPASDSLNTVDPVTPPTLFQSPNYREFARIDIGNAIAAIEGSIALNYLFAHGTFDIIDANKNGLVTAQELQNFADNAANIGMPEAGVMARFLGGTARIPTTGFQQTGAGESPDQPDVLQRRFNFFDYAADGQLNGAISIAQYQALAKNLLPTPDAFTVTDRQRASVDGFLLSPNPLRNYSDLQHTLPTYAFIPKRVVARFKNISPAKFGIKGRTQGPVFTLFSQGGAQSTTGKTPVKGNTTTKPAGSTTTTTTKPAGSTTTTTTTKPAGSTTTGTTTTTGSSTATPPSATGTTGSGQAATASGVNYIASLLNKAPAASPVTVNSAATSSTATPSPVTTNGATTGAPAAESASGVGTSLTSASLAAISTPAKAGTPAATTASSSTENVQVAMSRQTAAKLARNEAEGKSQVAPSGSHVAPVGSGNGTGTATGSSAPAAAAHSTKKKSKTSTKFDPLNPWKSITNIFKK